MAAPIAIFAFNRPAHIARMLNSAKKNPSFSNRPIQIYCDGPKYKEQEYLIEETRQAVREHAPPHAEIIEREENLGLARSIISGVTELCAEHGQAIVLEDDLVLSPFALDFLQRGLDRYAQEDKVMHISAYMFPAPWRPPSAPFFYREATCWGWATWKRAWDHFESDAGRLLEEIDHRGLRPEFDIRNSMYFYTMLQKQRDGEIDSWAIRWYASMFLRRGLSLHPPQSFVENLGFDGTGVHCNTDDHFNVAVATAPVDAMPDQVVESEAAIQAMIAYRQPSSVRRRVKGLLARWPWVSKHVL